MIDGVKAQIPSQQYFTHAGTPPREMVRYQKNGIDLKAPTPSNLALSEASFILSTTKKNMTGPSLWKLQQRVHHPTTHFLNKPVNEISNNVVCATSKGSDQPAHTRSLIRAFASRLGMLWLLSSFGVSKLNRRLHGLVWVYTWQNATLLEIRLINEMVLFSIVYFVVVAIVYIFILLILQSLAWQDK